MAHNNYTINPKQWALSSGNLTNGSLFSASTSCYLVNPTSLDKSRET